MGDALGMDVAGARALARRIAEGKPHDTESEAPPPLDLPAIEPPPLPPVEDTPEIDVVYFHPRAQPGRRRPWVFVRRADGRLRRAR
jgi:hypothetical protein